jgi:hypothetical protein
MPTSINQDNESENFDFKKGANWEPENVKTILQWIHISAINLDVMTEASFHYKTILRRNTIISLILSTLASTASLSQFNISEQTQPELSMVLKGFFTFMSIIIAISTGYLKVYQVHEKLEKAIKLQQEWTSFGSSLTSELQLPVHLRKDALYLIIKFKQTYTDLFKQQIDISQRIVSRVAVRNGLQPYDLTLSELFEKILNTEAHRLDTEYSEKAEQYRISNIKGDLTPPISFQIKQKQNENNLKLNTVEVVTKLMKKEQPKVIQQRQKTSEYIKNIPSKRNLMENTSSFPQNRQKSSNNIKHYYSDSDSPLTSPITPQSPLTPPTQVGELSNNLKLKTPSFDSKKDIRDIVIITNE